MSPSAPSPDTLDFYRTPAPMTAIDELRHGPVLPGVKTGPAPLAKAVRGVLIHRDWAPAYGLTFSEERLLDQHIRPIDQVLARVAELVPDPLTVVRAPADRMVGVCRHYAVLYAALLRRHGIPARARAGFGRYFGDGWSDHWVTERWDGRWVREDAQIGEAARRAFSLTFDPADQPAGEFLTGAEAWTRCRAGDEDPDEFGIFDEHGLWFILGDLFLDLAAINKVELLPWDTWSSLGGPGWEPAPSELQEIDELAALINRDELAETRAAYEQHAVPARITTFVDGTLSPVELGHLVGPTG